MNTGLRFIASNNLKLPYDPEKYFGFFVYLTEQQDNYKIGLYVGGLNCWERLTNDLGSTTQKIVISVPTAQTDKYYYNKQSYTAFPPNWNSGAELSKYCTITGNTQTNAGTYTATISINDKDKYEWSDGSGSNNRTWVYKILPRDASGAIVTLSSDTITFGDKIPTVNSVVLDGFGTLVKDKDYIVTNDNSKIIITFIGNFSGKIEKDISVNKKTITVQWSNSYNKTYDGTAFTVYPSNWNDIKDYCNISGNSQTNAGTYTATLTLKDSNNYRFDANSSSTKSYTISQKSIIAPTWNSDSLSKTYDGTALTVYPSNWNDIKDYCNISGNTQTNAGTYFASVTLKNTNNYKWSDDTVTEKKKSYSINRAKGYINNLSLKGNTIIDQTLTASYSNASGNVTYTWYNISNNATTGGSVTQASSATNTYKIKTTDFDKYVYVVANVSANENYEATSDVVITNGKVVKIKITDFAFNKISDNIYSSATGYKLPKTNARTDDNSTIKYTTNNNIISVDANGNVTINGTGTVVVTATITNSSKYDYIPNTATFTLTITSEALTYWGMFSKPSELHTLMDNGGVPENMVTAEYRTDGDGRKYFTLDFDEYADKFGSKIYRTFYFFLPTNIIDNLNVSDKSTPIYKCIENGFSCIIEDYRWDYEITINGNKYYAYSCFSDKGMMGVGWKMDVTIKKDGDR